MEKNFNFSKLYKIETVLVFQYYFESTILYRKYFSFILETYIAPLQNTTTQRRSHPSHGKKRKTSGKCKMWKGGSSARNAPQLGDLSMLMGGQPKRLFAALRSSEVGGISDRVVRWFSQKYRTLTVPMSVAQNIELFIHTCSLSGIICPVLGLQSFYYRTKSQNTGQSG